MIIIGSDHGGYSLKEYIIQYLKENNMKYHDVGCFSQDSCDYPIIAKKLSTLLINDNKFIKGILICGTGIGMSISANKINGIRAAVCSDAFSARYTVLHNNANILCLGERVVGKGLALELVDIFINTNFSKEDRHINRIRLIEE
ncbi:MAG: ribose 5-phosphate isomerase B [Oscillospiraceae bacterium]|nr:ribose 5-phosphate isomerase B [Oscillospiraceae bacterium]